MGWLEGQFPHEEVIDRLNALMAQHREMFGDVPTTLHFGDLERLCTLLEEAIRTGQPLATERLQGNVPEGALI